MAHEVRIELVVDSATARRLEACAAWRQASVSNLLKAYVEDWLEVDGDEMEGRVGRNSIYRDYRKPIADRLRAYGER